MLFGSSLGASSGSFPGSLAESGSALLSPLGPRADPCTAGAHPPVTHRGGHGVGLGLP